MQQIKIYYSAISIRCAVLLLCAVLTACQSQVPHLAAADTAQIDRLLQLVDTRLAVAPLVARAKWNSGKPIDDVVRERSLLADVSRQANAAGVDTKFAIDFFQAQINSNKLLQRRLHTQWQREAQPPFAQVPDLATEVRPVLDRLTPQLIDALHGFPQLIAEPEAQRYLRQRAEETVRGDFDGEPRAVALRPLFNE